MRTTQQIEQDLRAGEYDLTSVLDAVIRVNGIIGVGRVTLAEQVAAYIRTGKDIPRPASVPVLVVVRGGVAYPYAPANVAVVVVDRDNIEAGDETPVLPAGIGFEELCEEAGFENGEVFVGMGKSEIVAAMNAACAYCSPLGKPVCGAQDPERGNYYTRPLGHVGEHVACGLTEHDLNRWTNKQGSAK